GAAVRAQADLHHVVLADPLEEVLPLLCSEMGELETISLARFLGDVAAAASELLRRHLSPRPAESVAATPPPEAPEERRSSRGAAEELVPLSFIGLCGRRRVAYVAPELPLQLKALVTGLAGDSLGFALAQEALDSDGLMRFFWAGRELPQELELEMMWLMGLRWVGVVELDGFDVFGMAMSDRLPLSLLREALQGVAHFGRRSQARLALLAAALVGDHDEAARTAEGLRRAAEVAEMRLKKLSTGGDGGAADRGQDTVRSAPPSTAPPAAAPEPSDTEEDVSWFFDAEVAETLTGPVVEVLRSEELQEAVGAASPEPPTDDDAVACLIAELRQGGGATMSAMAQSGSGRGQQCFVYGRLRPVQPRRSVLPGVVCHLPQDFVSARGEVVTSLRSTTGFSVARCALLDANLTLAAYESSAPALRRIREVYVQEPEETLGRPTLFSVADQRGQRLAQQIRALGHLGIEALLLSGDASDSVLSAGRAAGLLVAAGIPARLLYALAEDCGATVLRGLPDLPATYAYMPWESQKPLQIQIAELSKSERRHNFCFPLIGHRQSLLPQASTDLDAPFYEFFASSTSTSSTVLLEAPSEPQLRQLCAQLTDLLAPPSAPLPAPWPR
ncbi:Adenylate cyclase 1, partial [Durusdinium trenchii]